LKCFFDDLLRETFYLKYTKGRLNKIVITNLIINKAQYSALALSYFPLSLFLPLCVRKYRNKASVNDIQYSQDADEKMLQSYCPTTICFPGLDSYKQ
jgi:hypothetical protein